MVNISIEKNIMVPMRDGIQLATYVYRLEKAGSKPVLVARSPYSKDDLPRCGEIFDIFPASSIVQHVHPVWSYLSLNGEQ